MYSVLSLSLLRILIFEIETIFSLIHLDRWYRRRREESTLCVLKWEERKSFLISSKIHFAHGKSTFKTMKICCAHTHTSSFFKQELRSAEWRKRVLSFAYWIAFSLLFWDFNYFNETIMGELKNWNSPTNLERPTMALLYALNCAVPAKTRDEESGTHELKRGTSTLNKKKEISEWRKIEEN